MNSFSNKHYNHVQGVLQEDKACKYLVKIKKYKILERNFKSNIGEIDIIATDKKTIVFVEVKYRTSAKFGLGRDAVNEHKIMKIRNTALSYLKQNSLLDSAVRFDVLDILNDKIDYIENAF